MAITLKSILHKVNPFPGLDCQRIVTLDTQFLDTLRLEHESMQLLLQDAASWHIPAAKFEEIQKTFEGIQKRYQAAQNEFQAHPIEQIHAVEWVLHILGLPARVYFTHGKTKDGSEYVVVSHPKGIGHLRRWFQNMINYKPQLQQGLITKVAISIGSFLINLLAWLPTLARNIISLVTELPLITVRELALSFLQGDVWLPVKGLAGFAFLIAAPLAFLFRAFLHPIDAIDEFNAWGTVWGNRLAMLSRITTMFLYTVAAVAVVLGLAVLLTAGSPVVATVVAGLTTGAVMGPVAGGLSVALAATVSVIQTALTFLGLNIAASLVLAGITGFLVGLGVVAAGPTVNEELETYLNADRIFESSDDPNANAKCCCGDIESSVAFAARFLYKSGREAIDSLRQARSSVVSPSSEPTMTELDDLANSHTQQGAPTATPLTPHPTS